MADKYRRDGTPYPEGLEGLMEWGNDHADPAKRIVKQETLPNGYWVSTVWIGYNHRFDDGPPLIFETMVQDPSGAWTDFQERYSSEDDAIIGHMRAVDEFNGRQTEG